MSLSPGTSDRESIILYSTENPTLTYQERHQAVVKKLGATYQLTADNLHTTLERVKLQLNEETLKVFEVLLSTPQTEIPGVSLLELYILEHIAFAQRRAIPVLLKKFIEGNLQHITDGHPEYEDYMTVFVAVWENAGPVILSQKISTPKEKIRSIVQGLFNPQASSSTPTSSSGLSSAHNTTPSSVSMAVSSANLGDRASLTPSPEFQASAKEQPPSLSTSLKGFGGQIRPSLIDMGIFAQINEQARSSQTDEKPTSLPRVNTAPIAAPAPTPAASVAAVETLVTPPPFTANISGARQTSATLSSSIYPTPTSVKIDISPSILGSPHQTPPSPRKPAKSIRGKVWLVVGLGGLATAITAVTVSLRNPSSEINAAPDSPVTTSIPNASATPTTWTLVANAGLDDSSFDGPQSDTSKAETHPPEAQPNEGKINPVEDAGAQTEDNGSKSAETPNNPGILKNQFNTTTPSSQSLEPQEDATNVKPSKNSPSQPAPTSTLTSAVRHQPVPISTPTSNAASTLPPPSTTTAQQSDSGPTIKSDRWF